MPADVLRLATWNVNSIRARVDRVVDWLLASSATQHQTTGDATVAASDVYSLGVSLFRMLAGKLPFVAENLRSLIQRIT